MRVKLLSFAAVSALICTDFAPVSAQIGGLGGSMNQYGMPQIGNDNGANQQSQPAQDEKKESGYPADDPIVNSATPPPASTRLLTKVSWCEVQVFGHSFTDAGLTAASLPATHMHLSDRLQQLNQKLNFKPGKKGVELMDNVDELVTVISKRPPSEAASAIKKPAK